MGTPYYHTNQSAVDTIQNYADIQGMTFTEALHDMGFCYDDLDSEDKAAYNHYFNKLHMEKCNG